MTLDEMAPLRVHAEPQVRKLAEHYGALWDAASDLCFSINADDITSELRGTSAEDPSTSSARSSIASRTSNDEDEP